LIFIVYSTLKKIKNCFTRNDGIWL
jgi:hypothetical protein